MENISHFWQCAGLLANSFSVLDYLGMLALNSSINLFPLYIWVFLPIRTFYALIFIFACAYDEILG